MKNYYCIIKYDRGNHSEGHVFSHGKIVFDCYTKKELMHEIAQMRSNFKDMFIYNSWFRNKTDYIRYKFENYWFFKVTAEGYKRIFM